MTGINRDHINRKAGAQRALSWPPNCCRRPQKLQAGRLESNPWKGKSGSAAYQPEWEERYNDHCQCDALSIFQRQKGYGKSTQNLDSGRRDQGFPQICFSLLEEINSVGCQPPLGAPCRRRSLANAPAAMGQRATSNCHLLGRGHAWKTWEDSAEWT